ncbi:alpha/beta hydrolase [Mesorhizobium sp. Root102]|uniref:alpha/beta fold hydrolase n=1 Tax=Mesorhizobium sp. Root102 TaxID=1736422 RepID=UPI00070107F4|nr:alpha/beta hydrolase [Mesorhizobium sp. Root102]KQU92774.1 alpha/beta hydrolase [Mesorhizobium sp. Root102]
MFKMMVSQGLLAVFLSFAAPAAADTPVPSQADWNAARKTVTTADGQMLSYVEMGAADGQPVLLLHGYTDNSRAWSMLAPLLTGRRLIALDLRGHGGSAAPDCCYGLDSFAHDVNAFMEVMHIDKADVVGHSLGSMTAATLAAYYPERVDQLVLLSTATNVPKGTADWLWDNVPKLKYPIDPNSEFMKAWYANPTPVNEDFITRERGESAAVPAQVWMGVLRALTPTDWSSITSRITAPTLVIWGDQDPLFDAASQTRLKELLPAAEYKTFTGLGHNFFWEQPEKAAKEINGFLTP